MAVTIISIQSTFQQQQNRAKITLRLKNPTDDTQSFSIYRTDKPDISKQTGELVAGAEAYFNYYDPAVIPGKLVTYDFSGINSSPYNCCFTIEDDAILSFKEKDSIEEERILNIRYNPDISSVKYVIGETITQTLGSVYPYVRRNGNMKYKQFNIGGLISYHGFHGDFDIDSPFFENFQTEGLNEIDMEIVKEAQFRERVLDFLYDSNPKVFKSNTEGCSIIRLTNISLTPNKQLGRSIYSFTAQATEIAEPTVENLLKYGKGFALTGPFPLT